MKRCIGKAGTARKIINSRRKYDVCSGEKNISAYR